MGRKEGRESTTVYICSDNMLGIRHVKLSFDTKCYVLVIYEFVSVSLLAYNCCQTSVS